jgi:hypothetical protein
MCSVWSGIVKEQRQYLLWRKWQEGRQSRSCEDPALRESCDMPREASWFAPSPRCLATFFPPTETFCRWPCDMVDERDYQLPACQKCKLRKIKCDRQAPKCSNCSKANVSCIIVDPLTGEQYARDYIRLLEEKELHLKQRLGESNDRAEDTPAFTERSDGVGRTPTGPATAASTGSHGGFVGDGSGLGFLQNILSDVKWQHHRAHILRQLANRPQVVKYRPEPNALPPPEEAQRLLDNYFVRFHVHHAFLLRGEILDAFSRIYAPSTRSERPSAQDYFRLLMVFAISETTRHRACQGIDDDAARPYGYYLAAEPYLASIPLIKDTNAIQNLLLVARFSMYHHIGTSIWEISRLCMRQAIEWQLHTKSKSPLDPMIEQHQRRIFWECYVHDRFSSGILGRPFAILESEISVSLPIDADDETIISSGTVALDSIPISSRTRPSELSVNLFCIKLRRISSRVHSAFYSGRRPASHSVLGATRTSDFRSVGHVYSSFSQFHKELDLLRASAPIFAEPRCLYERSEWHDFMYEKDRLLLARAAMYNVPARPLSGESIINEILIACYMSATRTIELYADLRSKDAITWTRSYFQVLFTAGLTVIYCISLDILKDRHQNSVAHTDPLHTLDICSSLLNFFKEKMADAGSFAIVFDVMKEECVKDRASSLLPSLSTIMSQPTSVNHQQQQHHPLSTSRLDQNHASSFGVLQSGMSNFNTSDIPSIVQHQDTNIDRFASQDYTDIARAQLPQDFGLGLTDDLMSQLEAGLGEYAWGSMNMDGLNFWDQFGYE